MFIDCKKPEALPYPIAATRLEADHTKELSQPLVGGFYVLHEWVSYHLDHRLQREIYKQRHCFQTDKYCS